MCRKFEHCFVYSILNIVNFNLLCVLMYLPIYLLLQRSICFGRVEILSPDAVVKLAVLLEVVRRCPTQSLVWRGVSWCQASCRRLFRMWTSLKNVLRSLFFRATFTLGCLVVRRCRTQSLVWRGVSWCQASCRRRFRMWTSLKNMLWSLFLRATFTLGCL